MLLKKLSKHFSLYLIVATALSFVSLANAEDDNVWTGTIDDMSIATSRVIIGDLLVYLNAGYSVVDSNGSSLSRSTLKAGLEVSATLKYRNNQVYTDQIIVLN